MKFSRDEFISRYRQEYGEQPSPASIAIAELYMKAYNRGLQHANTKNTDSLTAAEG